MPHSFLFGFFYFQKLTVASVIVLCVIHCLYAAPAAVDTKENDTEVAVPSKNVNDTFSSGASSIVPPLERTSDSIIPENAKNMSILEHSFADKEQIQLTPSSAKSSNLKVRKNKNNLFFCCPEEEDAETVTVTSNNNKGRERNTKTPVLKREKIPETLEPVFERKPALLLRFFPDGTAVLISKFQLHLHVKPKQIKLDADDDVTEGETLEFNPSLILNDGKSYEIRYKRLEAIPSAREQNEYDLDESEERELYSEDIDHDDHEFVTTTPSTLPSNKSDESPENNKLLPLQESTTATSTTGSEGSTVAGSKMANKTEKLFPTVGDSPFFMMTSEEMSSLQQQYDPALASPLKATESMSPTQKEVTEMQTTVPPTTTTDQSTVATPSSWGHTVPTSSTTKCLSFRNQLSLALSTEDNIDNSLLKRHIFPTQDCNSSKSEISNYFANLKSSDTITKAPAVTLPIITRLPPEPTTTPTYKRNDIVPYLTSDFPKHPSKPDVVVVTSLPVVIDLKSTRNQQVTQEPAWREVTVGVVRDQQGQPLKPKYNNWISHLRGISKKNGNKFWKDFVTSKPDVRSHAREPLRQNIQQSSSQVNRAFWTDLQRQYEQRSQDQINVELYRTNPPKNYPAQNKNEFQFWRNRTPNSDRRWDFNSNLAGHGRTNEPQTMQHRNYENMEVSL